MRISVRKKNIPWKSEQHKQGTNNTLPAISPDLHYTFAFLTRK